jgi:hypothetical protein
MKKYFILSFLSLAVLGACDKIEPDNDKLIVEAKTAIAAELADPATAQFRAVRVAQKSEDRINGIVCGEILGEFEDGPQGRYRTFIYAKLAEFAGIDAVAAKGTEMSPEAAAYKTQFDDIWESSCKAS